jgi:hypothetical protein
MEDYKFFTFFKNDKLYTTDLSFGSHICNQSARIRVNNVLGKSASHLMRKEFRGWEPFLASFVTRSIFFWRSSAESWLSSSYKKINLISF